MITPRSPYRCVAQTDGKRKGVKRKEGEDRDHGRKKRRRREAREEEGEMKSAMVPCEFLAQTAWRGSRWLKEGRGRSRRRGT